MNWHVDCDETGKRPALGRISGPVMNTDIDEHFGNRLRRRRRMLGLTQQDVAERVGVRFQQIQKYECGANRMSAARLWQMVQALDVPVTYFYDGLEAPKPQDRGTDDTLAFGCHTGH